ncbi:uncharacterized protein TM35_000012570 [Trypanosoma theileri]|uniref:Uncharacterized protein n=1 Tax=Trypanosoma theileri TaxID=67003 RepID=A0A1X0PAA2_9TRYP|nr:uncharacterized protein TM35_000012570 [Trypanosoma theileri]ORC93380.1 hypothetical protein TM35_000012570 [Trypanosoma theileri]
MSRGAGTTPSRLPQSPAVADNDNDNEKEKEKEKDIHVNSDKDTPLVHGHMLYNTTVRSFTDPRPVMLRVPLRTPRRDGVDTHTSPNGDKGGSNRNYNSNNDNNSNNNNNINSTERMGGNNTNLTLLKSPAPAPPAFLLTDEKNHEARQVLNSPARFTLSPAVETATRAATTTTTTTALRRSSSTILVSPRPSPPRRTDRESAQREVKSSSRRHVRMRLSQRSSSDSSSSSSDNNDNNTRGRRNRTSGLVHSERRPIGELLIAVPPRRRITSPLQHLLVYNNNDNNNNDAHMQYRVSTPQRGNTTSRDAVRFSQLPRPPFSSGGQHMLPSSSTLETPPLTSDAERLSPTSLHYSLPRDTRSKSLSLSSSSSLSSSVTTSAARRQRNRGMQNMGRNSKSSKHSVIYPLLRENEGWTTSDEESSNSSMNKKKKRRKQIITSGSPSLEMEERKRSANSDKSLRNSSRNVTSEPQCLPTSRTSLTQTTQSGSNSSNKSRRARSAVPAKSELMKAFHELQLEKEAVVLMEYEEKGRRTIRDAYIKGMRRMLLEHTFQRSMLLASGERNQPQTSSSCYSSYSYSSPQRRSNMQTRPVVQGEWNDGKHSRKDNIIKSGRHSSTRTSPNEKVLGSTTTNRSSRSSVEVISGKNKKKFLIASSTPTKREEEKPQEEGKTKLLSKQQQQQQQQQQREEKHEHEHEQQCSVGSSSSLRKVTKYTSPIRDDVNESMDDIQRTMRVFEIELLRMLSEEINERKFLIENESAKFYLLLRYHRIMEAAMQPTPIYLHEACEWQSILTEATNELHRLQSGRIELEIQQRLQIARDCAHRIAALINNETQIREKELRQAELQERRDLARLFHLGLAALLEVQACYTRQHERQKASRINIILQEEVREREMIHINELRSRSKLYRRIEAEYHEDIHTNRNVETTTVSHQEKDVTVGEIPIELSDITSIKGDRSYMTAEIEVQQIPSQSEIKNVNTTTFSTVHSGNTSAVHPVLIEKSAGNDDGYSLSYPGNEQNVERFFFEWNPTSNTIPSNTHNSNTTITTTGTGTGTAAVGGTHSLVLNSSSGEQVRPWTISSPPPRSIPHTNTTTDSTSKYNKGNTDTTGTTATTTLVTNTLPYKPKKGKIKQYMHHHMDSPSSRMPHSTPEVSKDSYNIAEPSILSVEDSFLRNTTHRDIGITANLSSQPTSQLRSICESRPPNCHLVPCSLKKKEKTQLSTHSHSRCSATPLPVTKLRGEKSTLRVSCGTQLTPPTRRPYQDDVIFDGTPQKCQKHFEENELLSLSPSSTTTSSYVETGVDVEANKKVISEPSEESVSSSCSSFSSLSQSNSQQYRQNPHGFKGKKEEKEEENVELFDSVEELEEPCNWSQTSIDFDENYMDEKQRGNKLGEEVIIRDSDSKGSPVADIFATTCGREAKENRMRSERTVSRTSDIARRASETMPEVSLSTMHEATAAGSVDYHDNERNGSGQRSAAVVLPPPPPPPPPPVITTTTTSTNNNDNNDTSQSDVSSCSSLDNNVTANIGLNVKMDDNRETYVDDYNKENLSGYFGRLPSSEEVMAPLEKCQCECVSNYPPFNYMRPTMSWRRQHEELEWRALQRSSRSRNSNNVKWTSVNILQSPSRRRSQSNPSQHLKRIPFEEGPGVWGDLELQRRPFAYDPLGEKAYKASERLQPESSITTTICSPRHRQDAARRFMSEGSSVRGNSRRSLSRHSSPIPSESPVEDPVVLASLQGIIEEREVSPKRVASTPMSRNTGAVARDGSPNLRSNEKLFGIRKRSKTPSYVDAFFKQDREVVGRRCFLAALQHGPVLRDSVRNETPVRTGMSAAKTTPHRRHCLHHQRCSENTHGNTPDIVLSPGTLRGSFSRSSWSPQPKPWR